MTKFNYKTKNGTFNNYSRSLKMINTKSSLNLPGKLPKILTDSQIRIMMPEKYKNVTDNSAKIIEKKLSIENNQNGNFLENNYLAMKNFPELNNFENKKTLKGAMMKSPGMNVRKIKFINFELLKKSFGNRKWMIKKRLTRQNKLKFDNNKKTADGFRIRNYIKSGLRTKNSSLRISVCVCVCFLVKFTSFY